MVGYFRGDAAWQNPSGLVGSVRVIPSGFQKSDNKMIITEQGC